MNTAYDIPFLKKFKSPIEFIDYSSEELRSRAIDMIKKINKMNHRNFTPLVAIAVTNK